MQGRYDNPVDECCYCSGSHYSNQCPAAKKIADEGEEDYGWENYYDDYDEVIQAKKENWG